jgi:hypothetical protein
MQKKENTWKIENKTSKLKKNGSKIRGERRNVKKGKNMGKKWTCPFECFLHLFVFVFLLAKKSKTRKQNPFFSPLFSLVFPFYCVFVFFYFADLLFVVFCFCRAFFCKFLKKLE